MNPRNPLLLPEILSKVLEYVDLITLKSSRLVSSFWNVEAGRILSSSFWVEGSSDIDEENDSMLKLANLQQTLATSQDPGKFFGKFRLCDDWFPGEKLHELLQNFGKYLKAFDYNYSHDNSTEDGSSYCQLLIHRVITEWCPYLEDFSLTFDSEGVTKLMFPIPSLNFNGPNNITSISIYIVCQIPNKFQDFLVRIVQGCSNLKVLKICREVRDGEENEHMYEKLAGLQHITKNLNEFMWCGRRNRNLDWTNVISTLRFSDKLKSLSICDVNLDLISFPVMAVMLNSIGPSLKKLRLLECNFPFDTSKEFQLDLFKIVIKSLVNLEILDIHSNENSYEYFFLNADSLDARPHQNLRHLFLPRRMELNLLPISSVSTVVKWFPNLTRLSFCLGCENDLYIMRVGPQSAKVVGILAGLKRLEDLSLRICTVLAPGDLQKTLRTLKQIPKLLCFTLEELDIAGRNARNVVKITHTLKNLRYELKKIKHLNIIRLVGFKFTSENSVLDFAMKNGINLKLYEHYDHDYQPY